MFTSGNEKSAPTAGKASAFTTLQPLVGQTDEALYFYESPTFNPSVISSQPLYFTSNSPYEQTCFSHLQPHSAGSFSSSSEGGIQAQQFVSPVTSDTPGLDRHQATPSPVESSCSSDYSAKKSWSREETLGLLELYRNKRKGFRDPKIKNKQVWEQIAEAMQSDWGSCFSAKECETKFKNLKRSYTSCVDHNKISGNDTKKCAFFDELQDLFSKDVTIEPVATCSNRKGYHKKRQAEHSSDVDEAVGTDSTTEEENREIKTKKKKQTPRQRSGSELVTLFKEYTVAREESEKKKLKK